jgi:predicted amidohydrolase
MDCPTTIVQFEPALGDVAGNLAGHLEAARAAAKGGSKLAVFPELSLTGYFLKDQTAELALTRDSEPIARLAEASRDIAIVAGFVERADGERLYNALGWFENGELLHVHRKVHLVSYGMFDESRDVAAGEEFAPVESALGKFGLLVCEDMWHVGGPWLHFMNDVDALIVSSASPARGVGSEGEGLASTRTWDVLTRSLALWFQTWVVYANRVGWEDGIGFGGGSRAIGPDGELSGPPAGIEPCTLDARLTSAALRRARVATPLRRDEKPWIVAAAMKRLAGWEDGEGQAGGDAR